MVIFANRKKMDTANFDDALEIIKAEIPKRNMK